MRNSAWEGLRPFVHQGYYKGKFQDDNCGIDTERTQSRLEQEDKKQHERRVQEIFFLRTDGLFDWFGYVGSIFKFCCKEENKQQKKLSIYLCHKKQCSFSILYGYECLPQNADMLIMTCRY